MATFQGAKTQAEVLSIKIFGINHTFDLIETKSEYFISANIYTSLLNPLIRMSLVISDYHDILKNMLLKGDEQIQIKYRSSKENDYITLDFKLNSITNERKTVDQKTGILIFDCVSYDYEKFYYKMSKRLVGKSNTLISNILTNIVNTDKTLHLDYNNTTLVDIQTNNKNILNVINLISKTDDIYFYEDWDGYHLDTLDYLLKQNVKETFYFLGEQTTWIYNNIVKNYEFEHFNNEILLSKNVLNTKYLNLGSTDYKLNYVTREFSDIGDSNFFDHIGKDVSTEVSYGNIKNKTKKYVEVYNVNTNTIKVKVNGNDRRKIGDKIKLDFRGFDGVNSKHKLYNSEWLIVEICNEIVVGGYVQHIKLALISYPE